MLAGCGLLRHRQAAVPLPPLQRRRVVCCVLRAARGARCAALGALLRLRACALQPRARAPPRSAALVERVVLLVLGQRGDDSLLGRPAIPGSAGRRGWAGEAGFGRAGCTTLLYSGLLCSTLLWEAHLLKRSRCGTLTISSPWCEIRTWLPQAWGWGWRWGQGQGHSLLAPAEVLTVIGRSLVCVAVTSADGKTFLTKRVAASRSWCPPSL